MLVELMQFYIPDFVKKKKLNELIRLTADAFHSEPPEYRGLSFQECLSKYALYTKKEAESYYQVGYPLGQVKSRLFENSCAFGQTLRESLHVTTWEESAMVLKAIYKHIGIDFHYDRQGQFQIKKCFFSKYYSGEVCRLISSVDEGIASGLSGEGRLSFTQRITEGCNCCKGYFSRGHC